MVFMSAVCISGVCVYVCMAYVSVCSRVQLCGMYVQCVCVACVHVLCCVWCVIQHVSMCLCMGPMPDVCVGGLRVWYVWQKCLRVLVCLVCVTRICVFGLPTELHAVPTR